jgi:hypothetical protein
VQATVAVGRRRAAGPGPRRGRRSRRASARSPPWSRGLSNRQIAEALVLEHGTVANHVRHVLHRLGLDTSTQLGVWFARDARRRAADAGLEG